MHKRFLSFIIRVFCKDCKESEGKLFKLVVSEHCDGNTMRRIFSITCEHFIWDSKDWLHDDFYQIIKDCGIIDTEEIDNLPCVIENKEVNRFYYFNCRGQTYPQQ
jgi:hypothetical protein